MIYYITDKGCDEIIKKRYSTNEENDFYYCIGAGINCSDGSEE